MIKFAVCQDQYLHTEHSDDSTSGLLYGKYCSYADDCKSILDTGHKQAIDHAELSSATSKEEGRRFWMKQIIDLLA
jgi:hypothetical protein